MGIPEVGAFFSGGGFSNYVSSFVIQLIHHSEMANQSLRSHLTSLRPSMLISPPFPPANTRDYTTRKHSSVTSFGSTCLSIYLELAAYVYFPTLLFLDVNRRFGQAYPDISAQAWNFLISWQGSLELIGGTSAATPTVAGIVTLLNDAQIAAGKPPLGFLNPFLYSKGAAGLNDITTGNAPGCGTQGFYVRYLLGLHSYAYTTLILSDRPRQVGTP